MFLGFKIRCLEGQDLGEGRRRGVRREERMG